MQKIKRHKTREIQVGPIKIGGNNPIVVQSMTSTKTRNVGKTLKQINELYTLGCKLVRVAVANKEDLEALEEITKKSPIPIIADIHFRADYALSAMEKGVAGIRINPGNIGKEEKVKEIVEEAKKKPNLAIRIGVNSGSLEKDLLEKYGHPTAQALAESALRWCEKFEKWGFKNYKVSIKASDVLTTIEANRIFAKNTDVPIHIGITEAGFGEEGIIKSSVGLGILLYMGIGDTLRVSLTGEPKEEVRVAYQILRTLNLSSEGGIEIISCPTCGRIETDLTSIVREVKEKTKNIKKPLKVAIMGCVVNGPGEAKEADIGLACGKEKGVIFKKGKPIKVIPLRKAVEELISLIHQLNQ